MLAGTKGEFPSAAERWGEGQGRASGGEGLERGTRGESAELEQWKQGRGEGRWEGRRLLNCEPRNLGSAEQGGSIVSLLLFGVSGRAPEALGGLAAARRQQ